MTLREQIWIAACKNVAVIEEAKSYSTLPSLGADPAYDWDLVLRFVRMIMGNNYKRVLAGYPDKSPIETLLSYESFKRIDHDPNYKAPEWYYIRDRRAVDFIHDRFNLNEKQS